MKKILFILLTIFGFTQTTKADTIDFWHVYYNKSLIHNFNQYGAYEITFKLDSIKNTDSITVEYFRDTPCSDCPTYLTVENLKHKVIVTSK